LFTKVWRVDLDEYVDEPYVHNTRRKVGTNQPDLSGGWGTVTTDGPYRQLATGKRVPLETVWLVLSDVRPDLRKKQSVEITFDGGHTYRLQTQTRKNSAGGYAINRVAVTGPDGVTRHLDLASYEDWKRVLDELGWDSKAEPFAKTR
jgi:hypothetical protein